VGADQALLRVSDSIAYVAAARHVYAVVDDLVWHPQHVEITANEAMQAAGGSSVAQEAKEFLPARERMALFEWITLYVRALTSFIY